MCASTELAGTYFAPGCLHGMFGGGYRTGLGAGIACLGILLLFFSLSGFASICAAVSARCVFTRGVSVYARPAVCHTAFADCGACSGFLIM